MSLAVGQRIGAFEITESLGAGGMGEVYRATDTTLKRHVAIKIVPGAWRVMRSASRGFVEWPTRPWAVDLRVAAERIRQ